MNRWLVSGSYLAENYLEAAVISPQGIVGRQRQTHRGAWERARGLERGDTLEIFQTPIGAVGLILGEDIRYPEVGRILALQGADILVHLAADDAPFHAEASVQSLWCEAQANQTFGIQACLVGGEYHGRGALLAPVEMTDGDSGVLAQADIDVPACIIADFDHDARRAVQAAYDVTRYFNVDLYRRELLPAYGEAP
jgi:predicted amidohydrolase